MTDRTMYDSTVTTDIPDDAEIVAYYPKTYPGDVSQFKNARIVEIDNQGDQPHFAVLDVESGAASVATAVTWTDDHNATDGLPDIATLYCNKDTLPALLKAIGSGRKCKLWIADPTGVAHVWDGELPSNVELVATQYAWPGIGSPGHYDMSVVSDDSWFAAKPAPKPATTKGLLVTSDLAVKNLESSDGKVWTVKP
jgi:hypothetical protein